MFEVVIADSAFIGRRTVEKKSQEGKIREGITGEKQILLREKNSPMGAAVRLSPINSVV